MDTDGIFATLFPTLDTTPVIPFTPTVEQNVAFRESYKTSRAKFTGPGHSHLLLHLDRMVQEQMIINLLPGNIMIHDVGGASKRHMKYNRTHVWSSQPLLTVEDHFRPVDPNIACRHMAQICDCKPFDIAIFIHSMYYLNMDDIIKILLNTTSKKAFSLMHVFDSTNGSFGPNNHYTVLDDVVTMFVSGNYTPYVHPNNHWLKSSSYTNGQFSLVWSRHSVSDVSSVFEFRVLNSTQFLNHTHPVNPDFVTISAKGTSLHGIWPFHWTQVTDEVATVPADVYSALKLYAFAKPKNDKLYSMLGYKAMSLLRDKGVSTDKAVKMQSVMCSKIMNASEGMEKRLLLSLVTNFAQRDEFNNMLKLSKPLTSYVGANVVSVLALTIMFGMGHYRVAAKTNLCMPAAAAFCWLMTAASGTTRHLLVNHGFDDLPPPAQEAVPILLIDSEVIPIAPTGSATVTRDIIVAEPAKGEAIPVGIVLHDNQPVVYGQTQTNAFVSVSNRGLITSTEPSNRVMSDLRAYVWTNIKRLFPDFQQIEGSYTQWNNRYPAAQRLAHDKARAMLPDNKVYKRKSFVKVEKLLYNVNNKFIDKAPRLIQGAQDTYNVIVGPWVYAFSKELIRVWNADHSIFYTSGASGEEIGAWLDEHCKYLENDYSKFDSTIGPSLLLLELDIYAHFGMPKYIHDIMKTNINKSGITCTGVSYTVSGTRPSGDQNTSCGNSLINGLVMAWALSKHYVHTYKMVVLGDDNLLCYYGVLDETIMATNITQLGLNPKLVSKTNPNILEYCSSRFWPTPDGRVLGPKIGRFLTKVGWMLNPPKTTQAQQRMFRGTLMSHINSVGHVPICKEFVDRMLYLIPSKRYVKDTEHRLTNKSIHTTCSDTWNMVHDLYELTIDDVNSIVNDFAKLTLGQSFTNVFLEVICGIDC